MHLGESQLVDLALGRGSAESAAHVEVCSTCRDGLDRWCHAMKGLQTIDHERLDEGEMHRLRTLFTSCVPARSGLKKWAARLVRSSVAPATAGIRGRSGHELREYEAGPHMILVQLTDEGRCGWTLHGQVLTSGSTTSSEGHLAITNNEGCGGTTQIDPHGEFHLSGLAHGSYAVTWWLGSARIDEPDLILGGDG